MGRATYFPPHRYKKSVAARIIPRSITSPKLSENCAGLTAIATVGKRQLTTVSCGTTPASAQNYVVFRAPSSGATIIYAGISPGSDQSHAAAETDTWIFDIVNRTSGNSLSQNTPSLSGQTLAATAYKELPVNGGNSTVPAGETLRLEASVSGSPDALNHPMVAIEWVPCSNA